MKVLVVFGTRPEAIKLAPVIRDLRSRPGVIVRVVTTAQHRELLDPVLAVLGIEPDVDLAVMRPRQTLAELSGRVVTAMDSLLAADRPDVTIVQGDTTSAFMCGIASFYRHVPVAHVEAGLRTGSPFDPFPEEMNRRLTAVLSSFHFAPTARARDCLLREGAAPDRVFVTGNTVVDALLQIRQTSAYRAIEPPVTGSAGSRLLLVTLHRRESWGAPLAGMCRAIRQIVESRDDVHVVIPVHLNPNVRLTIDEELKHVRGVTLIEPLDYLRFIALMETSWLVLTDSGGVQEEAPALGRPVLVLRNTTERPEAVDEGVSRLVGTDPQGIARAALRLLDDPEEYAAMARTVSPFGDGHAARRIGDILESQAVTLMALAQSGRLAAASSSARP